MKILLTLSIALFALAGGPKNSPAQENPDKKINWPPQAYPLARYELAWSRNPFDLKTVPPPAAAPAAPGESFAKHLAIAGVSRIGEKETLILFDLQASKYLRLTAVPNADGMKLVSVRHDPDIKKVVAKIAKGSEEAEVRYARAEPAKRPPPSTRPGPNSDPAGRPGEASSGKGDGRN